MSSQKLTLWGSKAWANDLLSYVIRSLKGECFKACWDIRVQFALIVKADLLENGFFWQAARVDNWIHRIEKQHKAAEFSPAVLPPPSVSSPPPSRRSQ